ncbi:uncharacterized protein, partial [Panulirus ornatus]|uniref:uncharacterized protein n=1 Tax=Panulirus ornatus TaxID=150431 RepID=UPI003A8B843C
YETLVAGRRRQIGGHVQCPKCSTPWIAGFCQPRLLGFPRSIRNIKHLLKKEHRHPGKLRSVEKIKLSSFRSRQNILEVTCLICKYKMRQLFSAHVKEKPIVNTKIDFIKRNKKKVKEVNAGLHLSSLRTQSCTGKLCKSLPLSEKCLISIQEKNISTDSSDNNLKLRNDELCDAFKKSMFTENESLSLCGIYEKTLPARVTESTANISSSSHSVAELQSKSAAGSRLGSKPGSSLISRPKSLHPREKREKQKQLLGLKNAVLKDIDRQSKNDKSSPLNDFLNSLF